MRYVKYTREKIYVENEMECIARLCKTSAEFYYDKLFYTDYPFWLFKEKIEKDFPELTVDEKQAPAWCREIL